MGERELEEDRGKLYSSYYSCHACLARKTWNYKRTWPESSMRVCVCVYIHVYLCCFFSPFLRERQRVCVHVREAETSTVKRRKGRRMEGSTKTGRMNMVMKAFIYPHRLSPDGHIEGDGSILLASARYKKACAPSFL